MSEHLRGAVSMKPIRISLVLAVLFGSASCACAQSIPEKLCIFSAAQKLPSIPGLLIVASRVKELSSEARTKGAPPSVTVEIDVKAAAQEATYSFICRSNDRFAIAKFVGLTADQLRLGFRD